MIFSNSGNINENYYFFNESGYYWGSIIVFNISNSLDVLQHVDIDRGINEKSDGV